MYSNEGTRKSSRSSDNRKKAKLDALKPYKKRLGEAPKPINPSK